MLAVHVNWTAPFAARHPGADYEMDWLEAVTSIASAVFWTKRDGEIVLYTDSPGLRHYRETGIADVYDHIDVSCLDDFTARSGLDPAQAPYVTRMHVAGRIGRPFVIMDLDFVLFDPGRYRFDDADLCCFHWELPTSPWYPPMEEVFLPDGFRLPAGLDFATLVPNTAFLYVGDPNFMRTYAGLAEDYVARAVRGGTGQSTTMVAIFADQRLLGLLAQDRGLRFDTLRNDIWTCGPLGKDWSVLSLHSGQRVSRDTRNLVSPVWVLDRSRFDERKESVDCLHVWFEKSLYNRADQRTPRRQAVVEELLQP